MNKRNQVRKSSSNSAAAPQSKTPQTRAQASSDCLCMYQAGQLAGEIPLVGRQLSEAIIAAYRKGVTVDQFIADAIRMECIKQGGGTVSGSRIPCAKKPAPKAAAKSVLLIFQLEDGTEVDRFRVQRAFYDRMEQAAESSGCSLAEWTRLAIWNKVRSVRLRRPIGGRK